LEAASEFSQAVHGCFGPVKLAIDRVFEEIEPDEEDLPDHEDDGEALARDFWSPETIKLYEAGKQAFLRAEAALSPLLLLLPEESVPIQAATGALDLLGTSLGSLNELPRDAQVYSKLYVLRAELEWKAFNNSVQRELRRAGKRVLGKVREREVARHDEWMRQELNERTETTG
jgi:hypothetical protein